MGGARSTYRINNVYEIIIREPKGRLALSGSGRKSDSTVKMVSREYVGNEWTGYI